MRPRDPLRSDETLTTILNLLDRGVDRFCVIMRHSDRHYPSDPAMEPFMGLTETGKDLALGLGERLPLKPYPAFFSSPFGRCIETACIMDKGYIKAHGRFNGHNTLATELSPFYIKDFQKALDLVNEIGTDAFLRQWFDGGIPGSVMTDPRESADIIARFMAGCLKSLGDSRIALCVSHDWNLYPLKEFKLGLPLETTERVGYLESVALFEQDGRTYLTNFQQDPVPLDL